METSIGSRPFYVYRFFLILVFLLIVVQLFRLQVLQNVEFEEKSRNNQFHITYTDAYRGIIYDSYGKKLVSNINSFSVVLRKKYLRDEAALKSVLGNLGEIFGKEPEIILRETGIESWPDSLKDLPDEVILERDATREIVLEIESNPEKFSGVSVEEKYSREYLLQNPFSHILGYVGNVSESDIAKGYTIYDSVGKDGLEYAYEGILRPKRGKKIVEVDALGRKLRERQFIRGEDGSGLLLNIESDLQEFSHGVLARHILAKQKSAGALVVSRVNDGAVLAIASYPAFDNNIFRSQRKEEVQKLLQDKRSPFLNRSIASAYPAGSTMKPFIAAASLNEKIIDPKRQIFDPGFIEIPNPYKEGEKTVFRDWKVFGYVDMMEALAWSANVYFYTVGGGYQDFKGLGIERIKKYATYFGLGNLLGIDLPGETKGLIPDPAWKKEFNLRDPIWHVGDTYNVSIGQGEVLVTPLQMNFATAVIANGGKLIRPRVVKAIVDSEKNVKREFGTEILKENFVSSDSLRVVREGMRKAVTAGSAWALADLVVSVAGKTGTAQTETQVLDKNHAWFTGFAPYENPEIAITVFVEKGGGGARMSVPIAKEILAYYFSKQR